MKILKKLRQLGSDHGIEKLGSDHGVGKLTTPLQTGKTPPHNDSPGYYTKQSDGEVPVMLGPWGIQSTPSLPLPPGPLWAGVVAPDRAAPMG